MGDEDPRAGGGEAPPRPPTLGDLASLCAELNRVGAKYVVVGGFAIVQAGYFRATDDVDLLVETTPDNEARVIQALSTLPERAAAELKPGDVAEFGVVRVGDEIMVDLMRSGCGVTYADAITDALIIPVQGVPVPFASPKTLWRMKQTVRAKDIPDRLFLKQLLHAQGIEVELPELAKAEDPGAKLWQRVKRWLGRS